MLKPHYGTALVSRADVKPGTAILHNGRYYRASVNVKHALYAHSLIENVRIISDAIEIYLNHKGQPLISLT
ncbi:TPA: cell division inhibitor protein [Escherichia coli]|uniref:cell division inhibitor protein n=1 Tax=Escherichia coli TaxID=562 RepID=UPI001C8DE0A8|nr:cell division inhibitor protein [Escherichia coli]MBY0803299.1 cell division inhibitor protein [Escherichia coli]MCE3514661.1 cell division inhibitor protein [Escherichia coli]MDA5361721.1 cell division inhibitor protein [Escherichia coli]HBB9769165.1 cell division inhibitor protein [Escherichia coli]HBB9871649.1 cell division inhibitor protein [Escherichia coli]